MQYKASVTTIRTRVEDFLRFVFSFTYQWLGLSAHTPLISSYKGW